MNYKRKKILYFLFFIFNFSFAFAQNKQIDSLLLVVKSGKEDTNRVNSLTLLIKKYHTAGKLDSAIYYGDEATSLAKKLNFSTGIITAYMQVSDVYYDKGDFTKVEQILLDAEQYCEGQTNKVYKARVEAKLGFTLEQKGEFARDFKYQDDALKIAMASNDKHLLSSVYYNMSSLYTQQGNYPLALEYALDALKLDQELGGKQDVATDESSIASVYALELDFHDALDYFDKAREIYKAIGDKQGILRNLGNMAIVYHKMNDPERSLSYDFKAIELAKEMGARFTLANLYTNVASTYNQLHDYDKSLAYSFNSIDICKEIGQIYALSRNYVNVGNAYLGKKNYKDEEKYTLMALAIADSLHTMDMVRVSNVNLSNIYAITGDWKKAYEHLQLSDQVKDSLFNDDKSKQIGKLEAKADFDKQMAIQQSEEDKRTALAAAESRRQKAVIFFVAAIALAVAVIAIIVFRSLTVTRRQKKVIEEQKEVVEQQKLLVEEQRDVVKQQKALVEEKNKEILDSITYAKRLQDAILPPLSIVKKYLPESFVLYKPKDIVAGDFYWLAPPPPEGEIPVKSLVPPSEGYREAMRPILIAACDCTGHGVPGAMVSVVCSNALNRAVKEFHLTDPGKILDKTRELVLETFEKSEGEIKDGMDISLVSITPVSSGKGQGVRLQWSGAYNSLWCIENGELKEIPGDKQPIGKHDNFRPFTTHTITITPPLEGRGEAAIYLFTDGYADQFGGPKGKKFKYKQLQQLIVNNAQLTMEEQKVILEKEFEAWQGNLEQVDDVLVIGIRI